MLIKYKESLKYFTAQVRIPPTNYGRQPETNQNETNHVNFSNSLYTLRLKITK